MVEDKFDNIMFNNEIANTPVGVPEDQFVFETIADLEIPTDLEAFDQSVDPEYEAMLSNASASINRFFPPPTHNINSPLPAPSMGRFNQNSQSNPPNTATMQGKIRAFEDVEKLKPTYVKEDSTFGDANTNIVDPIYSGVAATQFDRYYASPAFSRLGFHAYRDNEEYYNENSSGWEDTGRMFGQLTKLVGTGYLSSYRGMFEDDVMDLKSAIEYEDAVRIGSSSRDGFGAGFNNFVLNAGYTLGIIGSIAIEEAIMWGGTALLAATGVGAPAAAATGTAAVVRTGFNMAKLGKALGRIGQSFKVGKAFRATKDFVQGMKKIDKVRDIWGGVKSGDNILGKILLPETMGAFKALNTTKKAGENVTNMARFSKTIGGFYRDARSLNFALSEGRMEGGSVYKEQWQKNYLIQRQKNKLAGLGEELSTEQMAKVEQDAKSAAFTTTMWNAPVIYLSNQLLLGNAFGGFKRSFSQIAKESIDSGFGRIVRGKAATKVVKEGANAGKRQVQKGIYEGVEDSFLNWKFIAKKLKSDGLRGGATMAAYGALRYSAANISEGLQEVYQEAVSAGVKDYYTAIQFDPMAGGSALFSSSLSSGLGSQMGSQGLETFMSGFFMGGVINLPQKAIFQGIPTLYTIGTDKAAFDKHKANKKTTLDNLVSYMNKHGDSMAMDPSNPLMNPDQMNFIVQKQASEAMEQAQSEGDIMNFMDTRDMAEFQNLKTLFETGKQEFFKEQLQDYLELTDQELAEAFPSEKGRAKSGKLRSQIQENLGRLEQMEKDFNENKDKLTITADPSLYEPGSKQHEKETLKFLAQRHARDLYLFTKDGFQRAAERTEKIYDQLASHPIIKELAANDLTVLTTKEAMMEEMAALRTEVEVLDQPGAKREKNRRAKKLKLLEDISAILYDPKRQKKDGGFDRRSLQTKLTPAIVKYLEYIGKDKKAFVNNEMIKDVIDLIIDSDHLNARQFMYDKALRVMTDPEYLNDMLKRSELYFQFAYKNKMSLFRESIERFINKEEINVLLNQFANVGVYLGQEDMLMFGATGDPKYLTNFFNQDGPVNQIDDPVLYEKVQAAISVYRQTASDILKKDAETRAEEAKESAQDPVKRDQSVSSILDDAGIEGPDSKMVGKTAGESPYLDEVLKRVYQEKRGMLLKLGAKKIPTWEQFLEESLSKDIMRAYNGLKKVWFQTLQGLDGDAKMEVFNSDKGFKQWLSLQRTNDLVGEVLKEASSGRTGISLKIFLPELKDEQGVTEEDDKTKGKDVSNATIDILEKLVINPETQEATSFYVLVDKAGNILDEAMYEAAGLDPILAEGFTSKGKAESARAKLSNYVPTMDSFEFDGQTLNYGDRIQDSKTKKWYVVVSTKPTVEKYGNLLVLEEGKAYTLDPKQRIKKATRLKEGDFLKRFTPEVFNAGKAKLPANASKLRVDEATAAIPHRNDATTNYQEVLEIGRRRYDFILKNLTEKELNELEVIVTKNEQGGAILDREGGYLKFEDKEKNPFIRTTKPPYNIGLKLKSSTSKRINAKLEEAGIPIAKDAEGKATGMVGYIPNGDVILTDANGQAINPLSITKDQIKDLFNYSGPAETAASDIQRNFAIQFQIMNSIAEKMGDSESLVTTLEDIGGVNFFTTPGELVFDKKDKPVLDLNVQGVDGVTVVLENKKGKDGTVSTRFITNAERGEGSKVKKKIIAEMNAQNPNLYSGASNASRYVMVVKSSSGVYSYFPIKSDSLSTEGTAALAETLIKRSAETLKENVQEVEVKKGKKTKQTKDLKFNSIFNQEVNAGEVQDSPGFYMASKPGYTFEVNVGANGSVFIRAYDRKLKQSHNIIMSAEQVQEYAEFDNKEKFIEALITNYNDYISNIDVTDKAFAKKKVFFENLQKNGQLKKDAFKISFDKNVTTEEIEQSVTTQVSPNVRGASKLIANIKGVQVSDIKNTAIISMTTTGRSTSADGNTSPSEEAETEDGPTASDGPAAEIASIEELSQEEYDKQKSNDFQGLSKDQREYLAQKLSEQGEKALTIRELEILGSPMGTSIRLLSKTKYNVDNPTSNAATSDTGAVQKDRAALIAERNDLLAKIEVRQVKIRKDSVGKLKNSEIMKKLLSDKEIIKLQKQLAKVESDLGNTANKISDNLNLEDLKHIDEFLSWASSNLPDFISIEDIRTLGDNMKSGGERVGAFVMAMSRIAGNEKINGKLYVGATSKYAYHEAFHAVFRMLLNSDQQNVYYKLAKTEVLSKLRSEGKSLKVELEKLRNGDINKYRNWSQESLEKEYLEEYMADQFEIFKQSPAKTKTDSFIKSLFNKILEWIRNVLGKYNATQLQALYKDISAGKFKNSQAVSNPFTDSATMGITLDASKLLRYSSSTPTKGKEVYKTIPNKQGRGIVSAITARVVDLEMFNEDPNFNIVDAVEESIDAFKALYNIDNAQYANVSTQQLLNLSNITNAFENFRKDIVDSVVQELELYDIKLEMMDDLDMENEMEYGLRTTEQYGKDASQVGGTRSLSSFLRKYIATTTLSEKDEFGNEYINPEADPDDRIKIIIPVDFASAYSGFLKAASGTSDPVRILQQIYMFSQNNPQTKAVQEKLFNDLGLVWEDQLENGIIPGETNDNLLFQALLKGFENFKVDYLFLHTNTADGQTLAYSAANRDDAHTQVEKWETEYKHRRRLYLSDPALKDDASDQLDVLLDYLNPKDPIGYISNKKLAEVAVKVSEVLSKTMGIKLHPDYIQYSIAGNIAQPTKLQKETAAKGKKRLGPTKWQQQILNSRTDVISIEWDDIVYMKEQFDANENLMSQTGEEGVYNRLRKLGLGNSMFDETVGSSVFKNPAGDLVYAHQLPTFHLKRIAQLNDVDNNAKALQDLIDKDPYLASNYLLNDPAFRQMSREGLLKVTRIAGSKASRGIEVDGDGGVVEKYDRNEEGVNYGDFNPKQILHALLSAYTAGVNPKSGKIKRGVIPEGQDEMIALAPILLRVIEASNTGDMIELPVIQAVKTNAQGDAEVTDAALDAYEKNIEGEFARIQRELDPATRTEELHPGYNATKDGQNRQVEIRDKSGKIIGYNRAFKFTNNKLVLSPKDSPSTQLETGRLLDTEATVARLRDGTQKIFIKDEQGATSMGFFAEGESTNLEMSIGEVKEIKKKKKFVKKKGDKATFNRVKLVGSRKVSQLTMTNIYEKLGDAISGNKTTTHIKEATVGNNTYWVESDKMKDFIEGNKEFYVYELVDENILELDNEQLVEREKQAAEQEDYDIATAIRDLLNVRTFNYAAELEKLIRENAALPADQKEVLTLDSALSKIGKDKKQLRAYMRSRIDQEFVQFNREINSEFYRIDENGKPILELPKFLSQGVQRNEGSTGSEAEFQRANEKLNLTGNRTYNTKQIFINDWINTSSINDVLLGDQALTLKDAVDAVKRAKMQNAAYYSAASRIASPQHGILNPLQKISMFATTDPIGTSIHTGEDIEQADAQNWMSLKAFRYMWFGFGKLTETQSALLNKIEDGADISVDEIFGAAGAVKKQEMLNSKKLVYGDGKVFDKFSVVPLTKALTSYKDKNGNWVAKPGREDLHNMRVKMEQYEQEQLDKGIDTVAMVAPLSALKMMKKNITPIDALVGSGNTITQKESKLLGPANTDSYMARRLDFESTSETDESFGDDQVMELDANYMGLQVLNPSNKSEIIDPTQIKTLITGEQSDKTEVILNGELTTIGAIKLAYNRAVDSRLKQKYLDKRNLNFDMESDYAMDELHKSIDAKKLSPDLISFLKYAQTALKASASSAQLLEFFSFDEEGNPNFDFAQDTPIVAQKFKQLFLSYFSKGVMSEKLPGTAAALLSDYGFKQYRKIYSTEQVEGKSYIDRQEIIRTDDFQNNYSIDDVQKYGNEVLDLSDDNQDKFDSLDERLKNMKEGEFIIVKDRLRPDMKEYKDGEYTGIKYTESMMPVHSKDAYTMYDQVPSKSIPEVLSKMFGIRIPSQDNHSTVNIKVVDFLPVFYGSTIVSARELVEVSGADFDIDKLYIQMKDGYTTLEATKEKTKIYDVVVDMYEHKTEVDANGDPANIWVVDNLAQAQEQLNLIKDGGRGKNFGEIQEALGTTKDGATYYEIPHKRGDNKIIYIRGTQPSRSIIKDKLRVKGKPYTKPKMQKVIKEYTNDFESYLKWVNKAVQKSGSTFAEAVGKANDRTKNSLSDKDLEAARKLGFSPNAIKALRMLNLPMNEKAFKSYHKKTGRYPFSSGYNNEILDFKYSMMGHAGNTTRDGDQSAISYEPADMEILKDTWSWISGEVPQLAEMLSEDGIDANNLFGKWKGFANNKEGAKSIGAAVLPNLYLSLIQEEGVKMIPGGGFELNIGGQVYNGLFNQDKVNGKTVDRSKELKEDGTLGRRKQYIISALITAMTDNAKERLAAKLGLSRNALAIVTTMSAMGVPIRTSVAMMNHPTIREAYQLEKRAPAFEFDVKEFIEDKMDSLKAAAATYDLATEEDFGATGVSQASLIDGSQDPMLKYKSEEELEDKVDRAADNGVEAITREQVLRDYAVLNEFTKAYDVSGFLRPMGDLLNLAKGFGKDTNDVYKVSKAREDLGIDLTDAEFDMLPPNEMPIFDLRPVFSADRWQRGMLDIHDEFVGSILPKVFLDESAGFKNIFSSLDVNYKRFTKDERAVINNDMLSYITLQGYLNYLNNNPMSVLGIPTNTLLYPEQGTKDIVDTYDEIKELNGDKYNFFLDGFIRPESATSEGNKTGISMLTANTLTPLNDSQKLDVQNGFQELYADPLTRALSMKVLNYMIVKDGLQPVYRSIISSINPEMFADYMSTLPSTSQAFATMDDAQMMANFGMTFRDLKLNFIKEYGLHPKTAKLLKKKSMSSSAVFNGKSLVNQARKPFTLEYVESNPDKLFVIFDNESGTGTSNSKAVRGANNVISIVIKKDLSNNKESYYTGAEINTASNEIQQQIEKIKQNIDSFSGGVIIQNEIDNAELMGLQEFSVELYDDLLQKMEDNFGYQAVGLTDKQVKGEVKEVNRKAKNQALYLNDQFDRATITVDLYKGISARPKFEKNDEFEARKFAKIAKDKGKKYGSNVTQVKKGFKLRTVYEGKGERSIAEFPQVMGFMVDGQTRYFQLVRHAGPEYGNIGEGLSQDIATGTFAEYIEVDIMGSVAQTPVGFIFGERPTNNSVKETVKEANPGEDSSDDGSGRSSKDPSVVYGAVEYEYGTDSTLDAMLDKAYDNFIFKDKLDKAGWLNTPVAKDIIQNYQEKISNESSDIEIDGKDIKIGGTSIADQVKESEEADSFSIDNDGNEVAAGDDLTNALEDAEDLDTFSIDSNGDTIESGENANEGLDTIDNKEKLEAYISTLSMGNLMSLKKVGEAFNRDYSSIDALMKEFEKTSGTMEEFIEQLKSCF